MRKVPCLPQASCDKTALRQRARAVRAAIPPAGAAVAARAVARHFCASLALAGGAVFAGYWPLADELDPRPLMELLAERGARLALPGAARPGQPLAFHAYRWGDLLRPGPFGVMIPAEGVPVLLPDMVLVPLLAFDRQGGRLGYGGGFYDRTLEALRRARPALVAVGLAFAAQEVACLPHEAGDQRLDWIVTENGARRVA
ncbi:MAG: 5-formyltetrahydrofolate cyclo-ligase [Alphaproteobacteria bacterium]|nr:5-formyltetrahydrofolate cyclo-ligase [Alphaproteobacteria bacterium]